MKPDRSDRLNDGFIDELLDASLSRYSRVDPHPGLEDRVLRAVRDRRQEASRFAGFAPWLGWTRAWRWAPIAATVMALVIIASVVAIHRAQQTRQTAGTNSLPRIQPTPTPETTTTNAATSQDIPSAHVSVPMPHQPTVPRVHYAVVRPMMPAALLSSSKFPTPTAATGEEMLLARVVADTDPAYMAALATAATQGIRPLEDQIKPLEIVPISGTTDDSAPSTDAPAQNPPQ